MITLNRLVIVFTFACAGHVWAQTTISGADLALKSNGTADATSWTLTENGYVGTYIVLDAVGQAAITVSATSKSADESIPRLNIVIGDMYASFMVRGGPNEFSHTFNLPAGTHFVRIEFPDAAQQRTLTIHTLSVNGAKVTNEHSDANALSTANTYIEHFRRGPAKLMLAGVEPGTHVQVKMTRSDFNFGANVPGIANRWLLNTEEGANFQKYFLRFFNMTVPSNGGKWVFHEAQRDVVTTGWMDAILDFAQRNNLRARMHNLLWDHDQQPDWVQVLLDKAAAGDAQAAKDLRAAISKRIQYYVLDRATRYESIDVLNEASHKTRYWKAFGPEGIADIHNEVAKAAEDGGNPAMRICTNEYNVLQWSSRLNVEGRGGEPDPYANWYREQVEAIRDAGGVVSGIGVQYYMQPALNVPQPHSAARIHGAMQNLSVTGLPIELTEFAIGRGADAARNCQVLEESMRLMMGSSNAVTFLMFGFYDGATANNARGSSLVDAQWNITEMGKRYEQLLAEWSTNLTTTVQPDGSVNFTGYYGDYEISAGDKTYKFTLNKGETEYQLQ